MFRNLDSNGDWQFGNGYGSYVGEEQEIALNIKTRVMSFLGDCFFATDEGIDWWHLLDYRYQDRLENAVQEVVKNTPGVTGINSVDVILGANRKLTIQYNIQTIYSQSYIDEVEPIAA